MINTLKIKTIEAVDFNLRPPLGFPDDGMFSEEDWIPGGGVPGAVDNQGRQLLQPLTDGSNPILGLEYQEDPRQSIREAFLVHMFQLLKESPEMTATQFIGEARERGILIAPMIARVQNEMMTPLIKRELGIAIRNGDIKEPPFKFDERGISVDYDTPLVKSMRAGELAGIFGAVQMNGQLAQITGTPETLDRYDPVKFSDLVNELNSVPESIMRSDEEVEEIQEDRQEQMAAAQAAQAAPNLAKAAKDSAEAEQISREG